ncbi:MAG: damage-control phosphatase ARMT1 family protein [Kiritimatiellia bacterium]
MKACIECLPCLARNVIDLARRSAQGDPDLEQRIAAGGMRILADAAEAGYSLSPPCYARQLVDHALLLTDGAVPDPWAPEKKMSTELALKLMTKLDEIPGWNPDAFESRLRLSVAGNILDFAIYADLDMGDAIDAIREAFTTPLDAAAVVKLKEKMDEATSIFWIFDNCGEAVFDRLLIEPYREKATLAVRGKPVFNDITAAELDESGYGPGFARAVVSNDDGVAGVVPETCGPAFAEAFAASDLVVAKGQANFETLSDCTDHPIAFLFLAKCPVVTREVNGAPRSIQIFLKNF